MTMLMTWISFLYCAVFVRIHIMVTILNPNQLSRRFVVFHRIDNIPFHILKDFENASLVLLLLTLRVKDISAKKILN